MTTVAIISNGPSAKRYEDTDRDYDLVIGVNWTCLSWLCDWVCAFDGVCFGAERPTEHVPPRLCTARGVEPCRGEWLGRPKWFVHWHALAWLRDNRPEIAELLSHEYVMTWPAKDREVLYSGIAPLHLMHILGLHQADCYGYDMAGDKDHTGLECSTRQESRWERERKQFKQLSDQWRFDLNLMV
jgi:hypothetical protein